MLVFQGHNFFSLPCEQMRLCGSSSKLFFKKKKEALSKGRVAGGGGVEGISLGIEGISVASVAPLTP